MKIIALVLIVIIIPVTGRRRGGGGGGSRGGGGYMAGGIGTGYVMGKVIPDKPEPKEELPKMEEIPKECKVEVRDCITRHIYKGEGEPKNGGPCCEKFKNTIHCMCKFLTNKDPLVRKAANGVLRGCRYQQPTCTNTPMPPACWEELRSPCINTGTAFYPKYGEACCKKLKKSTSCISKSLKSPDPKLREAANGVLWGFQVRKP
ncbi:hypothetical protein EUTSA_v10027488mg [Eutrema salsugineum]|uniref:Bifunctional inhibitor/plant lipid transfer protein/seed storage helical domain-containing protein n=1 Tax=Eutrema salsugineum TaxID=72664 RepID=V4MHI6_EUTSA|nr:hypothetical protein EUTSA_v10027488mg [Eutrema salsugineum]